MYGHGFATLFLGEVYGMTGDETVKEKLQKAVRLIQKTQNSEGGWRYQPVPYDADISVTICQIMALARARDAGIKVEKEVIDKVDRVRAQLPESRRRVQLHGARRRGRRQRLRALGRRRRGALLRRRVRGRRPQARAEVPEAVHARPQGRRLRKRKATTSTATTTPSRRCSSPAATTGPSGIRPSATSSSPGSSASGCWSGDVTDEYATAMALIILQMPNRYLPVYTGKGPGS